MYYTLSASRLASLEQQRKLEATGLTLSMYLMLGTMVAAIPLSGDARRTVMGSIVASLLIIFYAAPLMTVLTVLRQRSAATVHLPLTVAVILNGVLWTAYGVAINDIFIWVPQSAGLLLGCIQLCLKLAFCSSAAATAQRGTAEPSATTVPDVEGVTLDVPNAVVIATEGAAWAAGEMADVALGRRWPHHSNEKTSSPWIAG